MNGLDEQKNNESASRPATRLESQSQSALIKLLAVDDDDLFLRALRRHLAEFFDFSVQTATDTHIGEKLVLENWPEIVLLDYWMPGIDGLTLCRRWTALPAPPIIILLTGNIDVPTAVEAMRAGAFDYVGKSGNLSALEPSLRRAVELLSARRQTEKLRLKALDGLGTSLLVGESPAMRALKQAVLDAAHSEVTVLVVGEHGTGKERVARGIHNLSARSTEPFLPVECSALSPELFESELFGHERGAFTGAERTRPGLCAQAGHGTLFLDEISEISLGDQAKLLRLLQEREYRPVGGDKYQRLRARIIAATNRDLQQEMAAGKFREDLYYRLRVFPIAVPPLRERTEDVELLTWHFYHKLRPRYPQVEGLGTDLIPALKQYPWPGNVRELENLMELLMVRCRGGVLRAAALAGLASGALAGSSPPPPAGQPPAAAGNAQTMEDAERRLILKSIRECAGEVPEAAKRIGLSPATIYRRLKKYNLTVPEILKGAS